MATRAQARDQAEAARNFFRDLARHGLRHKVIVVQGDERFLVAEALARVSAAAFPAGRDDFNQASYYAPDLRIDEVMSGLRMQPMFGDRRLIFVRDADRLAAADLAELGRYAQSPEATSVLVVEARKLDGRLNGVKALLAGNEVLSVHFGELTDADLGPWIARRAKRHGIQVARDVPNYLIDAVGRSLQELDLALEKVALYAPRAADGAETRVGLETVRAVVSDTRSRSAFELVDQLAARDAGAALATLHHLLVDGESPVGIVALIATQFRRLWRVLESSLRGDDQRAIASAAGIPGFRVNDYVRTAMRFKATEIDRVLTLILDTDRALKSSRLADRVLVERLILSVCAGRQHV